MIRRTDEAEADALRTRIMQGIEECEDRNTKVVLLMLLEVLDSIGRKIDAVMRDEETLRELVLNGDSHTHVEEHRRLREVLTQWPDVQAAATYTARKMDEERSGAASRRAVRDGWLVHVSWAVTVLIVAAMAGKYLGGG